ncbi:MAG: chorismate mutase, partial [Thermodesulfovibrionales bacterium]
MDRLDRLRTMIDDIDEKILDLLNKRAEVVLDVAELKRDEGKVFYAPDRERRILERLTTLNKGPFSNDA